MGLKEDDNGATLTKDMLDVLKLMEACLDLTESEFVKIRSSATSPEEHAWSKMQNQLSKTKAVMQSLLRRQHSNVSLLAGLSGIAELPPDARPSSTPTSPTPCPASSIQQHPPVSPQSEEGKQQLEELQDQQEAKTHRTPKSFKEIQKQPGNVRWELSVLRKVRDKLNEKKVRLASQGESSARLDQDLQKITQELATLEGTSQTGEQASAKKQQRSQSTPASLKPALETHASPGKDFEDMLRQIMRGTTPRQSRKNIDESCREMNMAKDETEDILELIGAPPTPHASRLLEGKETSIASSGTVVRRLLFD